MDKTTNAAPIRRKTYGNNLFLIKRDDLIAILRDEYGKTYPELSTPEGADRYLELLVEEIQKTSTRRGLKRSRIYAELFLTGYVEWIRRENP